MHSTAEVANRQDGWPSVVHINTPVSLMSRPM
jgi:hypothetical protein